MIRSSRRTLRRSCVEFDTFAINLTATLLFVVKSTTLKTTPKDPALVGSGESSLYRGGNSRFISEIDEGSLSKRKPDYAISAQVNQPLG